MGGDLGCEPPNAYRSGDLSPVPAPLWASFLQSCMVIPTTRMMVRIKQVTGSITQLLFLLRKKSVTFETHQLYFRFVGGLGRYQDGRLQT